ncbi:NACHT domain-containing protein [Streptomyces sp. NBC_00076]|uniref:NACHT domain-containing protein n=1 Tax=Streptomyces sp. NBC_00076 TaxID=2975642 RepID=UPI003252C68D
MDEEAQLDEELGFFGESAMEALRRWRRETGRTVRWVSAPGVLRDRPRAKLATVAVQEPGGGKRKMILKWCPPGRRARREPGAHRAAETSPPEEWAKLHLVRQPWDAVFLDDGGYLMFLSVAGGGIGRTTPLTELLKGPLETAACRTVVDSVVREWNPHVDTEELSVVDTLRPRLEPRLAVGSELHTTLERCFPGLWDSAAAWLSLPNGPIVPNPLALARGHEEFAELSFEVPVGKGQGDLHDENLLFSQNPAVQDLASFLLLDLDFFEARVALAYDPANLLLTVADHWFDELDTPFREALRLYLVDSGSTAGNALPSPLRETLDEMRRVGNEWMDEHGWGVEWRWSLWLSVMACALIFAGRNKNDPERLWWYVRLSASAAGAFLDHCRSSDTSPSGSVFALRLPSAPAGTPTEGAEDIAVESGVGVGGEAATALESSHRLFESALSRAATDVVPRTAVADTHLPRIAARLADQFPAPIPLLGEAGIGKSVLSAQIYERLAAGEVVTPLLVNCEHVSSPVRSQEDLDRGLGALLVPTNDQARLTEVTATCATAIGRRVVVILDTVDYLLNPEVAPNVVGLLRTLRARGVLTVFTCRQHDFGTWLRPRYGDLHRPRESTEVPCLTRDEVALMVAGHLSYRRREAGDTLDASDDFVQAVLKAYEGGGPLAELITRPLLLTMLCELFAPTGALPADLSATRLYARYFHEKVVDSRRFSRTTGQSQAKQELTFTLSAYLWNASLDTLTMWAPESGIAWHAEVEAFRDLLSETVMVQGNSLAGPQFGFRHQALTEYFIAMYLHLRAPQAERKLLAELRERPHERWFAWPMVRHIVAMAEPAETDDLLARLDLASPIAFRAAAFGAVEQYRENLLARLAELAGEGGSHLVDQLVEALPSVPDDGLADAVNVTADLLGRVADDQVCAVADVAGRLVARCGSGMAPALAHLLEQVRGLTTREPAPLDSFRTGQVVRNLLDPSAARVPALPAKVLAKARDLMRAPGMPRPAVRELARAFLAPGVTPKDREAALRIVLSHADHRDLSPVAEELVLLVVPWADGPPEGTGSPEFDDPMLFLGAGRKRSVVVRLRAVAGAALRHRAVADAVCAEFLHSTDPGAVQNVLLTLQEMVKSGGAGLVADSFLAARLPTRRNGADQVAGVLKEFSTCAQELRVRLARWFAAELDTWTRDTADAFLRLVRDEPALLPQALQALAALPEKDQDRVLLNLARSAETLSEDIVSTLMSYVAGASGAEPPRPLDPFLEARLYGLVAKRNPTAVARLAELADGRGKAASQAMYQLSLAAQAAPDWAYAELLQKFARHRDPAVRCKALRIVVPLVVAYQDQADESVECWLTEAANRDDARAEETALLLELSHSYVREGRGRGPEALYEITRFLDRVADRVRNGAVANDGLRQEVALLKTLSAVGDTHPLHTRAFEWLDDLLSHAQLTRVQDAITFAREALGRWIETGAVDLSRLMTACEKWLPANRIVMVYVVRSHDPLGPRSPRLDTLLRQHDCHASVDAEIAAYRHPKD